MPEGARHRTATVRTLQFSEFRLLSSQEFLRISAAYPNVREQMNRLAQTRASLLESQLLAEPVDSATVKTAAGNAGDTSSAATSAEQQVCVPGLATLMQNLAVPEPDDVVVIKALSDVEKTNCSIQSQIDVLLSAQLDVCRRLEVLQGSLKDARSQHKILRRTSVRASTRRQSLVAPNVAPLVATTECTEPHPSLESEPDS